MLFDQTRGLTGETSYYYMESIISIHFLFLLSPHLDHRGQLSWGERQRTPWVGRQPITELAQRQTTIHTHTYGPFSLINSHNKHIYGVWEEARRKATHTHVRHANSTQKGQTGDSNPEPSCCEETFLFTQPVCPESND